MNGLVKKLLSVVVAGAIGVVSYLPSASAGDRSLIMPFRTDAPEGYVESSDEAVVPEDQRTNVNYSNKTEAQNSEDENRKKAHISFGVSPLGKFNDSDIDKFYGDQTGFRISSGYNFDPRFRFEMGLNYSNNIIRDEDFGDYVIDEASLTITQLEFLGVYTHKIKDDFKIYFGGGLVNATVKESIDGEVRDGSCLIKRYCMDNTSISEDFSDSGTGFMSMVGFESFAYLQLKYSSVNIGEGDTKIDIGSYGMEFGFRFSF